MSKDNASSRDVYISAKNGVALKDIVSEQQLRDHLQHFGAMRSVRAYLRVTNHRIAVTALQSILPPVSLQVLAMIDFTRRTKKS